MQSWNLRTGLLLTSALGTAVMLGGLALAGGWTTKAAPDAAEAKLAELFDPAYLGRTVCGGDRARHNQFFRPGLFVTAANAAEVEQADDGPPLFNFLGELSYPVTTANDVAQQYFDQGLRLTYAFNHEEAVRAFGKAQALDPTCAMCYWGEAYALGPNINAPMAPEAIEPAFAAIAKARTLAGNASDSEQALIEALVKRYSPDPAADRTMLNAAYAEAMADVAKRFPDDAEIASLYADAVMNTSPWDYWQADGRTPKEGIGEAITAVERVLDKNPDHPYAIHLYIHLVEASDRPERAEPYAERLAATIPGAGHIVHMPSHIYFRVGRFLDSLASNWAAVAADEFYLETVGPKGTYRYTYYPHNVHFLLESARMAGDAETALEAAEKLPTVMSDEVAKALPWVEIIKAAPAFTHVQFSDPETTLAVPDPGDTLPYVKAMWHYARGVAEAQRGNVAAAKAESDAIAAMAEAVDWTPMVEGGAPAPELLEIARHIIAGRVAQAEGDYDAAAAAFEQAVAIQDALPYLEPPFWYYPVRQSLGAALLQADRAEEAEQVFQQALLDFPNNAWALWGLMEAQRAQGDQAGATQTAALLENAWAGGDQTPDLSRL